jgi:hypothetical protein
MSRTFIFGGKASIHLDIAVNFQNKLCAFHLDSHHKNLLFQVLCPCAGKIHNFIACKGRIHIRYSTSQNLVVKDLKTHPKLSGQDKQEPLTF